MPPEEARAIMDELGMSAAWLADQCGRSRRAVQDWVGSGDQRRATPLPEPIATYLRARLRQHRALPVPRLPPDGRARRVAS